MKSIFTGIILIITVIIAAFIIKIRNRPFLVYSASDNREPYYYIRKHLGRISAEEAVKRAGPYLEKSLLLRRGESHYPALNTNYVVYKDGWYYVFRDNYPWKAPVVEVPGTFEKFSVKVNAETGKTIPPEDPAE